MKRNRKMKMMILGAALMTMAGTSVLAAPLAKGTQSVQNVKISQAEAQRIARSQISGGEVREVKLKNKKGIAVYEVEIIKGNMEYEYKIDANTGNILSSKSETIDAGEYKTETAINNVKTKVSLNQAKTIALNNSKGGTVIDYELERKRTGYVYDIEVLKGNTKYEYKIDAETGNILSSKSKTRN